MQSWLVDALFAVSDAQYQQERERDTPAYCLVSAIDCEQQAIRYSHCEFYT